jgi:Spy/CpxP family protein refolding chaperone
MLREAVSKSRDRSATQPKERPMSDQTRSSQPGATQARPPRKRRTWLLVTATAIAAALTGAVATTALSEQGPPWRHGHMGGFMGGGMMGGGMMGGPFHRGGLIDPARAEDRADRMIRHLAIEIDASAEQQTKLRAIAKDAVRELLPMREKAQSAHERAHSLFTQPTVDRAAIEAFRAEQLSLADQASRRIAKAVGDAAEVLTPEQRRKIDEHIQSRRGHWRPWRRG